MKEHATVIEAKRLQGKDLLTWIQQEAGSNGVRIASEDGAIARRNGRG